MAKNIWAETRAVLLTQDLQAVVDGITRELARTEKDAHPADVQEQLRAQSTKMTAEMARRAADPAFTVQVKHVGTLDDPLLWERITNRWLWIVSNAEAWARRETVRQYDNAGAVQELTGRAFADVVKDLRNHYPGGVTTTGERIPSYQDGLRDLVRERLEHGLVGGRGRAQELLDVGGWPLLLEAERAVKGYQEVTLDQGEG